MKGFQYCFLLVQKEEPDFFSLSTAAKSKLPSCQFKYCCTSLLLSVYVTLNGYIKRGGKTSTSLIYETTSIPVVCECPKHTATTVADNGCLRQALAVDHEVEEETDEEPELVIPREKPNRGPDDLLTFPSRTESLGRESLEARKRGGEQLDIEAYAALYTGRTKISRLISKNPKRNPLEFLHPPWSSSSSHASCTISPAFLLHAREEVAGFADQPCLSSDFRPIDVFLSDSFVPGDLEMYFNEFPHLPETKVIHDKSKLMNSNSGF
ncbi:hypothetical protein L2E82_41816 [Cichorium intybus]|uniref:Uncharacterized protein n=1 Tax=Cichorium intybus TaxID=13427 RepID=A0ACB8ZLG2_CICIN|nr:hypothetical protein L2E82_41816 [Cichorium intybus]